MAYVHPSSRPIRLGLRARLRATREVRMASPPVDPEGVRLAQELLVDGAGPLYVHGDHGELRAAALRALRALDGHGSRR